MTPRRWKRGSRAADGRRDEQARGEPRRGDPEDAELRVPRARHRVGQHLVERDAEEAAALDAVVRRDDAHHDLQERQAAHGPEVLHDGALRRRRGRAEQRVARRQVVGRQLVRAGRVEEGHGADAEEQQDDAHARPDDRPARGPVADQRLVRPVARVGHRVAGPVGRGRPRRPEEEGGERARAVGRHDGAGRHGVRRPALAEDVRVVRHRRAEGAGAHVVDDERAVGPERVGAEGVLHALPQRGLRLGPVRRVGPAVGLAAPRVEREQRLAVQVVGRPVGRDVAAVPPDRADLHAAHRPPDVLAGADVVARDDDGARPRHDLRGNRRRLLIDAHAHPAERGERCDDDERERDPQSLHFAIPYDCRFGRFAGSRVHEFTSAPVTPNRRTCEPGTREPEPVNP